MVLYETEKTPFFRKSCYFFESVDGTAPESNSFQQSSEDSSAAPSPMLPVSRLNAIRLPKYTTDVFFLFFVPIFFLF